MVPIKKKLDRREARREAKALRAAHIEKAIEKELIERLKTKAYGDQPLNVNEDIWKQILDAEKAKEKSGAELEDEDELGEEQELEEEEEWDGREFVSDDSESEFGGLSDLEDMEPAQVCPCLYLHTLSADFLLSRTMRKTTRTTMVQMERATPTQQEGKNHQRRLWANGKRPTMPKSPGSVRSLSYILFRQSHLFTPTSGGARVEVEYEEERELVEPQKESIPSW